MHVSVHVCVRRCVCMCVCQACTWLGRSATHVLVSAMLSGATHKEGDMRLEVARVFLAVKVCCPREHNVVAEQQQLVQGAPLRAGRRTRACS